LYHRRIDDGPVRALRARVREGTRQEAAAASEAERGAGRAAPGAAGWEGVSEGTARGEDLAEGSCSRFPASTASRVGSSTLPPMCPYFLRRSH
jgi:hypothetical protein